MNPADQQLLFFNTLLQLERQARQAATVTELTYLIANETIRLLPYRQALVWEARGSGRPRLVTVSGVDSPDKNAPYILFVNQLLAELARRHDGPGPVDDNALPAALRDECREWEMGQLLWLPLTTPGGRTLGGALLMRDQEWQEAEIEVAARLFETYAHALAALRGSRRPGRSRTRRALGHLLRIAILVAAISLLGLPVRLSVLAPVEIVPKAPLVVTSPLNSVIDRFAVQPNQEVHAGDLLFHLDDTEIRSQLAVEQKALAVLRTEFRQARQKSFADAESRARLAELKAMLARKEAQIDSIEQRLKRSEVRAGQDGLTIFGSVNDWLGRPVATGEKILLIAAPRRAEARIMLPVEDAINLEPGAEVKIFLNIRPDAPIAAHLRRAAFEAENTKTGILAFRLLATLDQSPPPRIGLRGTARIYGDEVRLWYYLLRRPLIHLRQRRRISYSRRPRR